MAKLTMNCHWCGKKFTYYSAKGRERRFCSRECGLKGAGHIGKWQRENPDAKRSPIKKKRAARRKVKPVSEGNKSPCATCAYCGTAASSGQDHAHCLECHNADSDYYGSYVNISLEGSIYSDPIWEGCEHYKKRIASMGKKGGKHVICRTM